MGHYDVIGNTIARRGCYHTAEQVATSQKGPLSWLTAEKARRDIRFPQH